ncbi:hypothetical protein [Schinkia azotoformans]|uniref:phage lytic cycle repressor MrpR family protein n=1 Tax=Schinkia azotoformans TaxID=1454 RepID=UPI002DB8B095|nr:hypothetical protein [Schinkia azotoformans]MEC1780045.1 hypothetical protein [Schinkia azotoformans]MED4330876.1 hypothetical protein [Schinkia azotoformans]
MEKKNFFNEETKELFLGNFNEESRNTYSYVFRNSKEMEELIEKDVYDFTINQIGKLLESLKLSTSNAAKTYGRVISSYINWAIENNLKSEPNPLKHIGNEWFEQFVNKIKLFITEKELIDIEEKLVNYQDKVIMRLIFEGVSGYSLSELVNLTKEDIKGNTLRLIDEKSGERYLEVSDRAIKFIEKAIDETIYYNKNGTSEGRRSTAPLSQNDYVIKMTLLRSDQDSNKKSDKHLIYRRLSTISELFSLEYLTSKSLERSGMIKMGKDLLEKDGKLENEQLAKIAERFAVKKVIINGYETYNYFMLREFINIENIEDLYGK